MKTFTDSKGTIWTINVNVAAIKRVRALCGVDLYSIVEIGENGDPNTSLLERFAHDPVLLIDVIFAICKPEADLRGISDSDFGEGISGDVIDNATVAFLDELINFFPEARRMTLKKLLTASRKYEAAAKEKLLATLESEQFNKALDSNLEKLLNSYGNALGKLE